jgi:ATP-binding cassette, subfamily F, member 3
MVAGALPLLAGHMKREQRVRVGWFHQHQIEALDPGDTPLEILRRERPDDGESSRRSRLAQFGLSFDKQETTIASLSGGERARLLLNLVAMAAPHLLILDEPTNHLDIDSRRALLDALNDYEGAVILITHDRSLIELVADRLWLTADGRVRPFAGDMDDYARFVLERARLAASRSPEADFAASSPIPGDQDSTTAARNAARKAAKKRRRRGL